MTSAILFPSASEKNESSLLLLDPDFCTVSFDSSSESGLEATAGASSSGACSSDLGLASLELSQGGDTWISTSFNDWITAGLKVFKKSIAASTGFCPSAFAFLLGRRTPSHGGDAWTA